MPRQPWLVVPPASRPSGRDACPARREILVSNQDWFKGNTYVDSAQADEVPPAGDRASCCFSVLCPEPQGTFTAAPTPWRRPRARPHRRLHNGRPVDAGQGCSPGGLCSWDFAGRLGQSCCWPGSPKGAAFSLSGAPRGEAQPIRVPGSAVMAGVPWGPPGHLGTHHPQMEQAHRRFRSWRLSSLRTCSDH